MTPGSRKKTATTPFRMKTKQTPCLSVLADLVNLIFTEMNCLAELLLLFVCFFAQHVECLFLTASSSERAGDRKEPLSVSKCDEMTQQGSAECEHDGDPQGTGLQQWRVEGQGRVWTGLGCCEVLEELWTILFGYKWNLSTTHRNEDMSWGDGSVGKGVCA